MKKHLTILFMVLFIVLSGVLGILAMRLLEENKSLMEENKKLTGQAADIEEKVKELQTKSAAESENLESENKGLENKESENDKSATATPEESGEIPQQEAQLTKSASAGAIDVGILEPGTVVDRDEIDMGNLPEYFLSEIISEPVLGRINGKSYYENSDIGLDELRYLKVIHYNFDHEIQVGELIVNAELAQDFESIFMELFREGYELQSMHLIDNYWTGEGSSSDSASIDVNNTSAFCYRNATGGAALSNHAFGRAIDINPQQNPYVSYSGGTPYWSHSNADPYIDRETGAEHVITHNDICYEIFTDHGFTWGGDWENGIKDYQHFDKAA